ncbi:hypothetical protein ACOTTU_23180, partial [Roseobacter sp. EG26]|uniref:hypothetical protein n=1 Tax=Roseobacter sp. EG26 TaxID=3412477 RepID=UPI003CE4D3A2
GGPSSNPASTNQTHRGQKATSKRQTDQIMFSFGQYACVILYLERLFDRLKAAYPQGSETERENDRYFCSKTAVSNVSAELFLIS